ncbi:hypothetical protein PJN36_29395, partial [Mycobacterium kansasii]
PVSLPHGFRCVVGILCLGFVFLFWCIVIVFLFFCVLFCFVLTQGLKKKKKNLLLKENKRVKGKVANTYNPRALEGQGGRIT